jgi:acyl CoA:acetate/3-ketoacid CoA transferase alpha subunit
MNKVTNLSDAAALVRDGDVLAIGGAFFENVPMALIREIIRQEKKDLTIIITAHGIAVDILVGAGCVREVLGAYVGFEGYGLAPNFRRAVEEGTITFKESACYATASGLRATAWGLPFMPLKGLIGSDLLDRHPEYKRFSWDGEEVVLVPALKPTVALIHANRSDSEGNVQTEGASWDDVIAEAADRVIVTVEQIVPDDVIRRQPHKTEFPGFLTTAVVEVPYGAHPAGCPGAYDFDEPHIQEYLKAGKTADGFRTYLEEYVYKVSDHEQYLEAAGGIETVFSLRV